MNLGPGCKGGRWREAVNSLRCKLAFGRNLAEGGGLVRGYLVICPFMVVFGVDLLKCVARINLCHQS